ncbi:cytochrome P450 [Peniophora sp. CONT]|nr:cytochrome P450 [Peniophora sp. CONT]
MEAAGLAVPLLGLSLAILASYSYYCTSYSNKRYPPGPRGLPFVGNIFDMPRHHEWETFSQWALRYGDVVHVKIFGKHLILLNSAQAVNDLLDKRSSIYSDRPHFPLIDLVGQKFNFGFMSYGKPWSSRRRTFAAQFGRTSPSTYPSHSSAVMNLLQNLHTRPEALLDHAQLLAAQLILDVTYGLSVKARDDELVRNAEAVMSNVAIAVRPEMWIVNPRLFITHLPRWLGGGLLARHMRKWETDAQVFRLLPFKLATERDNGKNCLVKQLMEDRPSSLSKEAHAEFVMDCAAVAYGGGTDTVVAATSSFFLAMALYPDVQRKARSEIDQIVGKGRLPDFSDRPGLPYISAIVRETLRWNPPAPQGIPHLLVEDDEYRGYHIPKGSIIVGNIWHILHNQAAYAYPTDFEPERHLADGKLAPDEFSRAAFGFGRRVCPGKAFAEDLLWLLVAQVLSVFEIAQVEETVPLQAKFTSGTFAHPLPFKCDIKPRSEDVLVLLKE